MTNFEASSYSHKVFIMNYPKGMIVVLTRGYIQSHCTIGYRRFKGTKSSVVLFPDSRPDYPIWMALPLIRQLYVSMTEAAFPGATPVSSKMSNYEVYVHSSWFSVFFTTFWVKSSSTVAKIASNMIADNGWEDAVMTGRRYKRFDVSMEHYTKSDTVPKQRLCKQFCWWQCKAVKLPSITNNAISSS